MSKSKKNRNKRESRRRTAPAAKSYRPVGREDANPQTQGKPQPGLSARVKEINQLISRGNNKAAVSKAKQYHKITGTRESETILVNAYIARIRELITNGCIVEAKTLLALVRGRYDCPDHRVAGLQAAISMREGMIDELVQPLLGSDTSHEKRAEIQRIIKNELVDLNALAQCDVLPSDHPLKTGALAASQALTKVTTGFVTDEEIALQTISHRSPLAPWKMLIKALACFYRHDDQRCAKFLQAVDPESAPARLVPLIRLMVTGQSNAKLSGNSAILVETVIGDSQKMRHALRMLDRALSGDKPHKLFEAIRNAVTTCSQTCPELIERLKQHISIRCWMNAIDAEDVNSALGGPSHKNAYFWRLQARAAEIKSHYLLACALWEEFRKHALHEGWLRDKGQEIAVVYLRMANLLQKVPDEELEWQRSEFKKNFKGFESYYHGQPRSVLEAIRKNRGAASDAYFIYPERLYRMAGQLDPNAETFQQWLDWIGNTHRHWKKTDEVALLWHAAVPDDARPLLYLMKSAEKRHAFKKALGYLEKAEVVDGLNPDVRRARLRLLTATAIRHLTHKKTHLAQKDIVEMEVLPSCAEGDRAAFPVALKAVCAMIDRDESEVQSLYNELIRLLENRPTANLVIEGLLSACDLPERTVGFQPHEKEPLADAGLVVALARGCKLGQDMGVAFALPRRYEKQISNFFTTEECGLDPATIRIISEGALRNKNFELAYTAAGAGLVSGGTAVARFLLLRARSLPVWEVTRRDDCIAAALELARRERDVDLIDEAIELRRNRRNSRYGVWFLSDLTDEGDFSMAAEKLNDVLRREKEARDYPSTLSANRLNKFAYAGSDDLDDHQCRYCDVKNCPNRQAAYAPQGFDDDDFDYSDDFDDLDDLENGADDWLPDLPLEAMARLMEMFRKHGRKKGRKPDLEEPAQEDPELMEQLLQLVLDAAADENLPYLDTVSFPESSRKSKRTRRKR